MTCLLLAQDTQVKIVCVSDLLVIIVQSKELEAKSLERCRPCFQPGVIQYSKCGPVQRSNACGGFLAIQGGTNGGRMGEYHSDRQADPYFE